MLYTIERFEDGYILTNAGHGVKFFNTLQEIAAFLVEEHETLEEEMYRRKVEYKHEQMYQGAEQ